MRTWDTQRDEWRRLPVDDFGYVDAQHMLDMSDDEMLPFVRRFESIRYGGWRNDGNLWRRYMGLDSTRGKKVLDYGCGCGIESLQYARYGNEVAIADINQGSLELARRVLHVCGFTPRAIFLIQPPGKLPRALDGEFNLVVMNGVLHHIEDPYPAVQEAHRVLDVGGELRVMVYTDRGWRTATGTEPPADVTSHPNRIDFVRWGDTVGDWADWYDARRLEQRFGQWFTLREWHYIGQSADPDAPEDRRGRYGVGIMEKK